jgi:uncharacterized protein (TIGR03067 family)
MLAIITILTSMFRTLPAETANDKDLARLQGKWQVTKAIKRGSMMPGERIETMSFTFNKNSLEIASRRSIDRRSFTFSIDTVKQPKHIDLTAKSGRFEGESLGGIYRLEGDMLVVCLPHDDNRMRPSAFESGAGGGPSRILYFLDRIKD